MDVEQFIELVKERPCLYDCKDASNKNKKEKERHWKEIAEQMEITSEVAKSKWKNLKDNYYKHLKSMTVTSGHYLRYLHWSWAPNMEFMKKHMNVTWTTVNPDHNHQDNLETEQVDSAQSSSRSDRSEDMPVDNKREQTHTKEESMQKCRRIIYTENGHDGDYDATDLIFLGYAKAIKAFSIRRQAEIKLKIAKIITDEEVAQYEENSEFLESPVYYSQTPSPLIDPLNPKITQDVQIKTEDS